MDEPYFHSPFQEFGEDCKKRFRGVSDLDVKILYISSAYPERLLYRSHLGQNLIIMLLIGYVFYVSHRAKLENINIFLHVAFSHYITYHILMYLHVELMHLCIHWDNKFSTRNSYTLSLLHILQLIYDMSAFPP